MTLGKKISRLRQALGISQDEFAELLGIKTKQSISNWENDKSQPELEMLVKIARLCGVSLDFLAVDNVNDDAIFINNKFRDNNEININSHFSGNSSNKMIELENEMLKKRISDLEEIIKLLKNQSKG